MANIEELKSVFVNNKLGDSRYDPAAKVFLEETSYFSSTTVSSSKAYALVGYSGAITTYNIDNNNSRMLIFCVK